MDSPAALCAWIVEKFWAWTDWDEHLDEVVGRDTLLDSVMLYWLPATGAASARLYWESIRQVNEWISGRTSTTGAATSRRSSSPRCSQRRSAPPSGPSAELARRDRPSGPARRSARR